MAFPAIAACCQRISAVVSGFVPIIALPPKRAGRRQQRSAALQTLIYRETLPAEAMHARRAHRVSSTFDARLRAVTHAIFSKGSGQ